MQKRAHGVPECSIPSCFLCILQCWTKKTRLVWQLLVIPFWMVRGSRYANGRYYRRNRLSQNNSDGTGPNESELVDWRSILHSWTWWLSQISDNSKSALAQGRSGLEAMFDMTRLTGNVDLTGAGWNAAASNGCATRPTPRILNPPLCARGLIRKCGSLRLRTTRL